MICEKRLTAGVHKVARGDEKNEFLAESGSELSNHVLEIVDLGLNGQDHRHRVGGPRADLAGVKEMEVGGPGVQPEGLAERAAQLMGSSVRAA